MDTSLPSWVQVLQALSPVITGVATTVIAAVVAFIAYRQWKTANAKLALDLFERRFAVYADISEAARLIAGHGGAKNNDAWDHALLAWRASTFLFKKEIRDHLEMMLDKIGEIRAAEEMLEATDNETEWQQHHRTRWEGVKQIARLQTELPERFAVYMRMDQKL